MPTVCTSMYPINNDKNDVTDVQNEIFPRKQFIDILLVVCHPLKDPGTTPDGNLKNVFQDSGLRRMITYLSNM